MVRLSATPWPWKRSDAAGHQGVGRTRNSFHATVSPVAALTGLDFTLHLECKIIKRRGGWHEIKAVAMSEGPSGVLSASCSLPKRGYWRAWVQSSAASGYYVPGTSSALKFFAM